MVAPKKAKLAEAQASLKLTMDALEKKRAELGALNARLASLKSKLATMVEDKEKLELQV